MIATNAFLALVFLFAAILLYAVPIVIIFLVLYYVIKKAVKNAILEAKIEQAALDQIESSLMDSDCAGCIESEQKREE